MVYGSGGEPDVKYSASISHVVVHEGLGMVSSPSANT